MNRIEKHRKFLEKIRNERKPSRRAKIIEKASDDEIITLIEIVLNFNSVLEAMQIAPSGKIVAALQPIIKHKTLSPKRIKKLLIKIHPLIFSILTQILLKLFELAN